MDYSNAKKPKQTEPELVRRLGQLGAMLRDVAYIVLIGGILFYIVIAFFAQNLLALLGILGVGLSFLLIYALGMALRGLSAILRLSHETNQMLRRHFGEDSPDKRLDRPVKIWPLKAPKLVTCISCA